MCALARIVAAYLLTVLLAGTTPIGTGDAAHQDQLLQPAFAHVHLISGQVIVHRPEASDSGQPTVSGDGQPSFSPGAGAGFAPALGGEALTPPLRLASQLLERGRSGERVFPPYGVRPRAWQDPPPDPPPLGIA